MRRLFRGYACIGVSSRVYSCISDASLSSLKMISYSHQILIEVVYENTNGGTQISGTGAVMVV